MKHNGIEVKSKNGQTWLIERSADAEELQVYMVVHGGNIGDGKTLTTRYFQHVRTINVDAEHSSDVAARMVYVTIEYPVYGGGALSKYDKEQITELELLLDELR